VDSFGSRSRRSDGAGGNRGHEYARRQTDAASRFNAVLLSLFAGMGVLLAAIGIYGVVGFLVEQQTREIGLRMRWAPLRRAY